LAGSYRRKVETNFATVSVATALRAVQISVNTRVNRPQAGGYSKLRAIDVNDLALIRPFC
jgi:hypothetical protein